LAYPVADERSRSQTGSHKGRPACALAGGLETYGKFECAWAGDPLIALRQSVDARIRQSHDYPGLLERVNRLIH
jgi:hypothetical protein